ncbi:hypothetical protein [Streptomyces coeruleorubidus]
MQKIHHREVAGHGAQVECSIAATEGDWHKNVEFEPTDDDRLRAKITLPDMGLYRLTAKTDYGPTVTQLVFAGSDSQDRVEE